MKKFTNAERVTLTTIEEVQNFLWGFTVFACFCWGLRRRRMKRIRGWPMGVWKGGGCTVMMAAKGEICEWGCWRRRGGWRLRVRGRGWFRVRYWEWEFSLKNERESEWEEWVVSLRALSEWIVLVLLLFSFLSFLRERELENGSGSGSGESGEVVSSGERRWDWVNLFLFFSGLEYPMQIIIYLNNKS